MSWDHHDEGDPALVISGDHRRTWRLFFRFSELGDMLLFVPFVVLHSPFQLIPSSPSCYSLLLADLVHPQSSLSITSDPSQFLLQSFPPIAVESSTVFPWSALVSRSPEKAWTPLQMWRSCVNLFPLRCCSARCPWEHTEAGALISAPVKGAGDNSPAQPCLAAEPPAGWSIQPYMLVGLWHACACPRRMEMSLCWPTMSLCWHWFSRKRPRLTVFLCEHERWPTHLF